MDHILTTAQQINVRNRALKEAAKLRLANMKHKRKTECAPNRKQGKALAARVKDFELLMSTKNTAGGTQQRKDSGGFHKPGSNQIQ